MKQINNYVTHWQLIQHSYLNQALLLAQRNLCISFPDLYEKNGTSH